MLTILDTHDDRGYPRRRAELLKMAAAEYARAEKAEQRGANAHTPGGKRLAALAVETSLARAAALETAAANATL